MDKERIIYKHPTTDDIDNLINLELKVWGKEMGADRRKWTSRINIYPEGIILAIKQEKLIGVIATLIINWQYETGYFPTWHEATADGFITNHTSQGNTMYGVDLAVLPNSPQVASSLLKQAVNNMRASGIRRGVLGCRVPSLSRFVCENKITVIEKSHVLKAAGKDPAVRFFIQNGFKIIAARRDYFPPDQDSFGWGIILEAK